MTKLQEARKAKGISQSELARRAEMSLRTLQSLESGARSINKASVESVLRLAKVLECGIEDIIE